MSKRKSYTSKEDACVFFYSHRELKFKAIFNV